MDSNLYSILARYILVRDSIFYYLRPTEVSKVCVAVGYLLTDFERKKYMNPMHEIFWNFQQSNTRPTVCDCDMILMGDDVKNITDYKYDRIQICMGVDTYAQNLDKYNAEDSYSLFEVSMYLESDIFGGLREDVHLINRYNDQSNARISIYLVLSMTDSVRFGEPPLRLHGMDSNLNSLIREHDEVDAGTRLIERNIYCLTYSKEVCKYETICLRVISYKSPYENYSHMQLQDMTPEVPILWSIFRLSDNTSRLVSTTSLTGTITDPDSE